MIRVLYSADPGFPPEAQSQDCSRFIVNGWIVDATEEPTEQEIHEFVSGFNPPLKTAVWQSIKVERDRRKAAGVKVGSYWFHSDDGSRIQQLGLVLMGENIPHGLMWKTMSGDFVTMTHTLAEQIFNAIAANDQALFSKAEQHKAAMEASIDPTNYNFLTGWTPSYGE